MEDLKYQQIVDRYTFLRSKHGAVNMQSVIEKLNDEFCDADINEATIYSIIAWLYQQEVKKKLHNLDWEHIINQHLVDNVSLLDLAQKFDISSSLIAKKIFTFKYPQYSHSKSKIMFNNTCTFPDGKFSTKNNKKLLFFTQ